MSVLCFVESDGGGGVSDPSLRALTLARSLADESGEETLAVVAPGRASGEGNGVPGEADGVPGEADGVAGEGAIEGGSSGPVGRELVQSLSGYGVAAVCALVLPAGIGYAPRALAAGLAQLASESRATAVVAAATDHGNEVMAHLGAMTDLPLAANCFEAGRRGPTTLRLSRHRWGGSLIEDATLESQVALLTVSTDAVTPAAAPVSSVPAVRAFAPRLGGEDLVVHARESREAGTGVSLAGAKVVVSGGRGMGAAEAFSAVEKLAELLGGAVGVSRAVTSLGWRPHSEQVGQTGTRVAPDLYIACGISGAIQHLAGCQSAKVMVAINTDADAPIMGRADYAVIGDVSVILPALVEAVQRYKEGLG